MDRVKDKVAIVTGGALGIGRASCILLAKEGGSVAVTDVLDSEGQAVAREIRSGDGKGEFWHIDVTNEKGVERVFSDIAERFGRIDVLVNNAGIPGVKNKPTDQITEQEWDRVMSVNVKGVLFCTKHAIPYMRKAGQGSIVNLSSIVGLVGSSDVAQCASKGAVRLMTKADALLYAREGIRVNSVHPGYIWTPMLQNSIKDLPMGADEIRKQIESLAPLGRIGEADDVAYGILYLASDESKFVTGSELVIDGGYTTR